MEDTPSSTFADELPACKTEATQPVLLNNPPLPISPQALIAKGEAPIKKQFLKPIDRNSGFSAKPAEDARNAGAKLSKNAAKRQKYEQRHQSRAAELCSAVAKGGSVASCLFGNRCRFNHDIQAYLQQKPEDLPGVCPFAHTPPWKAGVQISQGAPAEPSATAAGGSTTGVPATLAAHRPHPGEGCALLDPTTGEDGALEAATAGDTPAANNNSTGEGGGDGPALNALGRLPQTGAPVPGAVCPHNLSCRFMGSHPPVPEGTRALKDEGGENGPARSAREFRCQDGEANFLRKDVKDSLWKGRMQFPRADPLLIAAGVKVRGAKRDSSAHQQGKGGRGKAGNGKGGGNGGAREEEEGAACADKDEGKNQGEARDEGADKREGKADEGKKGDGIHTEADARTPPMAQTEQKVPANGPEHGMGASSELLVENKDSAGVVADARNGGHDGPTGLQDGAAGGGRKRAREVDGCADGLEEGDRGEGDSGEQALADVGPLAESREGLAVTEASSGVASPGDGILLGAVKRPLADAVDPTTLASLSASITDKSTLVGYDEELPLGLRERKFVDFRGKLYLAPLTTVGNLPFRRVCKLLGADITCGEMALATNLLQGQASEWALLRRHASEDIFGVQLCGGYPDAVARAAEIVDKECAVDFVDVNMGCPIDLICNKGAGSALLLKSHRIESIVRIASRVLSCPLTVKLRTGYYDRENTAHKLLPHMKEWGAAAVTLHGRSRQQRYSRAADWDYIGSCASACPSLPIIGNGDVYAFTDYYEHMEKSPLATCMIARGALYKPWIFTEIKERRHWDISSGERMELLKKFVWFGLQHWGCDSRGVENTRRFLLEWLSYLHRYIPVGLLEVIPQRMHWRAPAFSGRDDLETLFASGSPSDWIKISEMLLGRAPPGFTFTPKHSSDAYDNKGELQNG